jgi:L-asparagine oxygenase
MSSGVPVHIQPRAGLDRVVLSGSEQQEMLALARYVTPDPTADPEEFCQQACRAAAYLPPYIAEPLRAFRRRGVPGGIVVIAGFPVRDVPPTPAGNTEHTGQHTPLARFQAIINEFLGSMVAYEAEGGGQLFQDMVPCAADATSQTSLSSAVELEVHTEQAFSELRPDFLSLACLRADPHAATYVLPASRLAAALTPHDAALLRKPRWTTTIDASFLAADRLFADGLERGPMPILYGADDDPFMVLDQDLMRGVDDEAHDALNRVVDVYLRKRSAYTLNEGDIAILDNLRTAHGRSPFRARFDGTDRFVVRSFITRDLNRSRHARPRDCRTISASCS